MSSSDSDESMVLPTPKAKSTPISIKREPVTSTESSSEEDDESSSRRTNPANHNPSSGSGESSSDEDEHPNSTVKAFVKKEPLSQQTADSSEESDNDEETPTKGKPAQNSSSEDEASNNKTQASINRSKLAHTLSNSEESSDDELPMDHSVSSLKFVKKVERANSDMEASKSTKSVRVQNESSSSEEESDDNKPTPTVNGSSSSEESDEDLNKHVERPKTQTQLVPASNNTQKKNADSSSEDESEEESDKPDNKGIKIQKSSLKQSYSSSSDSSDESEKEICPGSISKTGSSIKNSDVQLKMEIESTLDPGEQSSSSSDSEDNKWSLNRTQPQVRTPKLHGLELMEAVFREHLPVDSMDAHLGYEDITSEDEVWLIQCPKTLDATALKKQHIDLYGNTGLQIEEGATFKRYQVVSEPNSSQDINCILPSKQSRSFKMINIAIEGKIIIEEHVHVPKLKSPAVPPKTSVPLPSGLKVRHPLLGIGYKEHIKAAKKSIKSNIKQKKRKKDKNTGASDLLSISGHLNTSSSGGGHQSFADLSTDCVDGMIQLQKKKKKHKSDKFEGTSAVSASRHGEKRHNDSTSIPKLNLPNAGVKLEPVIESMNNNYVPDELTSKKHKKSKKESRVPDSGRLELAENTANGLNSSNDKTAKNKKSKKAKYEGLQDSPNIQVHDSGSLELAENTENGLNSSNDKTAKNKKSKKAKHEGLQDSPTIQVSLNSKYQEDFETPKLKKPKKSKHRESLPLFASQIKREIVSDETSEPIQNDSAMSGRKRKKDRDSSDTEYHSGVSVKKLKLNDSLTSLNMSLGKKKHSR